MDLNIRKMTNHPPSPEIVHELANKHNLTHELPKKSKPYTYYSSTTTEKSC